MFIMFLEHGLRLDMKQLSTVSVKDMHSLVFYKMNGMTAFLFFG